MIKKSKFLKWLVGNRPSELVCEAGRHLDETFENNMSLSEEHHRINELELDLQAESSRLSEYARRCLKATNYINEHKRKDGFLTLNEWQTSFLLAIIEGSVK